MILIGGRQKGLLRVSASGGEATPATELDAKETTHDYPEFLPDGRHFLYLARRGGDREDWDVLVGSLDSSERRLLPGIHAGAGYSPSGHLLFVRDRTLMAHPFDLNRLELTGEAFPVAERVMPGPRPFFPFPRTAALPTWPRHLAWTHSSLGSIGPASSVRWLVRQGNTRACICRPMGSGSCSIGWPGSEPTSSSWTSRKVQPASSCPVRRLISLRYGRRMAERSRLRRVEIPRPTSRQPTSLVQTSMSVRSGSLERTGCCSGVTPEKSQRTGPGTDGIWPTPRATTSGHCRFPYRAARNRCR